MRVPGRSGLLGAGPLLVAVAGPVGADGGPFGSFTKRVVCPSFVLVDAAGVPGFKHT